MVTRHAEGVTAFGGADAHDSAVRRLCANHGDWRFSTPRRQEREDWVERSELKASINHRARQISRLLG